MPGGARDLRGGEAAGVGRILGWLGLAGPGWGWQGLAGASWAWLGLAGPGWGCLGLASWLGGGLGEPWQPGPARHGELVIGSKVLNKQ